MTLKPVVVILSVAGIAAAGFGGYQAFDKLTAPNGPVVVDETAKREGPEPATAKPAPDISKDTVVSKTQPEEAAPVVKAPEVNDVIKPSFDIVRVEKDGNALVAGTAAPSTQVALLNNGKLVGTAKTDATGAFVILPSDTLQGENNVLTLRTDGEGQSVNSTDQVAVAIAKNGEPLVALLKEGKAVNLLQRPKVEPDAKDADKVTVAKSSAPTSLPEAQKIAVAVIAPPPIIPAPVPEPVLEPVAVASLEKKAVSREVKVSESTKVVSAETISVKRKPEKVAAPEIAPEEISTKKADTLVAGLPTKTTTKERTVLSARLAPSENKKEAVPALKTETAPDKKDASSATQPSKTSEATAPVETETSPKAAPKATVSVEAVEVEKQKLFIAGAAKPQETVRVYVDDEAVGDVKTAETGRWLLEKTKPLKPGRYAIRADQVKKQSGEVVARAEVPFVIEEKAVEEFKEDGDRTVIIRKSDNLWTIAQRLYGDGRRFTAIYENNRDQIRNPSLIFPGQVFQLPKQELNEANQPSNGADTTIAN